MAFFVVVGAAAELPFFVVAGAAAAQMMGAALRLGALCALAATAPGTDNSSAATSPAARRALASLGGAPLQHEVEWRVPVGCDFSGFFVEVVCGYLPFLLERNVKVHLLQQRCPEHFLTQKLRPSESAAYRVAQIDEKARSVGQTAASIAIEHAEPCKMRRFVGAHSKQRPRYVISRSMSEGVLNAQEVACANERADEIWVPTKYHANIFRQSGINKPRLTVIPESVDVSFFNPDHRELLVVACTEGGGAEPAAPPKIPRGRYTAEAEADAQAAGLAKRAPLVPRCQRWLQPPPMWRELPKARTGLAALLPSWRAAAAAAGGMLGLDRHLEAAGEQTAARRYSFLSVFKWEWRKGWDVLLAGYWVRPRFPPACASHLPFDTRVLSSCTCHLRGSSR